MTENRRQRRAAAAATRKRSRQTGGLLDRFDIVVHAKVNPAGPVVMVDANAKGRPIVEDLWPDVEWARDSRYAASFPPDWQFTASA